VSLSESSQNRCAKEALADQYDLFSPHFKSNPFPTFAHMREQAPVYGHYAPDGSLIWYITRYEDVHAILQDDKNFCKDPGNARLPQKKSPGSRRTTMHRLVNENMLFSDPPDHTRLRALVSQAFTPQRVAQLEGYITETVSNLIDAFSVRSTADLIEAYALPLPVIVICHMLGIPEDDRQALAEWSQAIISPGSRNLNYSQRKHNVQELVSYLDHVFDQRLADPRDDLISALVHAEQSGDKLSRFELSSMVVLLLVTGHETTVNLIGNGALALIQHQTQLGRLLSHPDSWDNAVEELLRYEGPVETSTSRWARHDTRLGGHKIKRGDLVRVVLASANRDGTIFESPDSLWLDRRPSKHLAFGYGIHYCLGASLARLEARIALQQLFERLPRISLKSEAAAIEWRSGILFRGLKRLDITWE
jgi:cytochrome P450